MLARFVLRAVVATALIIGVLGVSDAVGSGSVSFAPTEGTQFSGTVAHFTPAPSQGTATIDWGDGSQSPSDGQAVSVTSDGSGGALVAGTHTYAEEGGPTVTVTFSPVGPGPMTATGTATVADAALTATPATVSAVAGSPFNGPVANFTDADPNGAASDYSATIDWGDSSGPTAGTVAPNGSGGFTVSGTHTYGSAGSFPITVSIADHGATATAKPTASVVTPHVPSGLDFTFNPDHVPVIASSPITFTASGPPGLNYQWDFDSAAPSSIEPSRTASSTAVSTTHSFAANAVHDTGKVAGGGGQRQQTYVVHLHATDSFGGVADVSHQVVVLPDTAPRVDFAFTPATASANYPVTFVPLAVDPSSEAGAPDRIVEEVWDFGDGKPGLECRPGSGCVQIATTSAPRWLTNGDTAPVALTAAQPGLATARSAGAHAAAKNPGLHPPPALPPPAPVLAAPTAGFRSFAVNFFARALSAYDLSPLTSEFTVGDRFIFFRLANESILYGDPTNPIDLVPCCAKIVESAPAAELYNRAYALEATNFDVPYGEVTGAKVVSLAAGGAKAARRRHGSSAIRVPGVRPTSAALFRQVTLTAYNAEGHSSAITHSVPIVPDQPPRIGATFINTDNPGGSNIIFRPGGGGGGGPQTQAVINPITPSTPIKFDNSGTSDADGQVQTYVANVGTPLDKSICTYNPPSGGGGGGGGGGPPAPGPKPTVQAGGSAYHSPPPGTLEYSGSAPIGTPPAGASATSPARARSAAGAHLAQFGPSDIYSLAYQLLIAPVKFPCSHFVARNVNPLNTLQFPIITSDPNGIGFNFPSPGDYSVSIAAYDDAGLGSIERVDGFHVVPNASGNDCGRLQSQAMKLDGNTYGFSGPCVLYGSGHKVYFSLKPMDFNGVTVAPDPGAGLLVDTRDVSNPKVMATTAHVDVNSLAAGIETSGPFAGVNIVEGSDVVGRFGSFDPGTANDFLTNGGDPDVPKGATYHGFTLHRGGSESPFRVAFSDNGVSRATLITDLPDGFGKPGAAPPTNTITVNAADVPQITIITTNRYGTISVHHRPKARVALDTSNPLDFLPTDIGPIHLGGDDPGKPVSLRYDSATGHWTADLHAKIGLGPPAPDANASLHLVLGDGRLIEASGQVTDLNIPIFPPVFMDALSFDVRTGPLEIDGGVHVTALDLLQGQGNLHIQPSPLDVALHGNVSVAGIGIGSAYVEYNQTSERLSFGGHIGKDFGPASMSADVNGGIGFKSGDFAVEGDGRACLWICLDAKALVSSIAVAACGEIDLGITSIAAGLAYRFKGGFEAFTGCDLGPYNPLAGGASVRAAAGPTTFNVSPGKPAIAVKAVGSTAPPRITITGPSGDPRTIVTPAAPGEFAFAAPSTVAMGGGGMTKQPTALVSQDTVTNTTNAVIGKPGAGTWTVSVDPSTPLASPPAVATGLDPVTPASFKPSPLKRALLLGGSKVMIAGRELSLAHGVVGASARHRKIGAIGPSKVLQIDRSRLRGLIVHAPSKLGGTVTLLDEGPRRASVIGSYAVAQEAQAGVGVVFLPTADSGQHKIVAFVTQDDGVPRASVVLERFNPPPPVTPPTPRLLSLNHRGGKLRLVIGAGDLPVKGDAGELLLTVTAANGQRVVESLFGHRLHSLGGGRYELTLRNLDPRGRLHLSVTSLYEGHTSRTVSRVA